MQSLVGHRVEKVQFTGPNEVTLSFDDPGSSRLLVSWDAQMARCHLVRGDWSEPMEPTTFVSDLRRRLRRARVEFVRQRGFDRIVEVGFQAAAGPSMLVAELMGRHSNVMLLVPGAADSAEAQNEAWRVVAAAKWVGPRRSRRPVLPNKPYEPPPFEPRRPLYQAATWEEAQRCEGASPFLLRLLEAEGLPASFDAWKRDWEDGRIVAVLVKGRGAYPRSVAALWPDQKGVATFSNAVEEAFREREQSRQLESLRATLRDRLQRVIEARRAALASIEAVLDDAARSRSLQLQGELILAHQHQIKPGAAELHAEDYEGRGTVVPIRPDLTPLENARRLFEKARRAKSRASEARHQAEVLRADWIAATQMLAELETVTTLYRAQEMRREALERRWLREQSTSLRTPAERPFEGKAVRKLLGPGGWQVLYGENAEANDYLLVRVAKPNDLWLHVRGSASCHVLIPTANRPARVPREVLLFAAQTCALHSPSKHSSYVPVDYTLRKFVRKPRGAAPGTVVYERERTLHVDPKAAGG
jgi:predicted ribosome quality control (RQC) complex YloA/Tae2 family protein